MQRKNHPKCLKNNNFKSKKVRSCDKIVDEKLKKKSENQSVTARKRKKKEKKINLGID
jgi:hypothetical protein